MPDGVQPLLDHQRGLARRRQLIAAGITPAALRWRLTRDWRLVLPSVVATFTGSLDPLQRLIAGQLLGGDAAMIAGPTAAAWHDIRAARGDPKVWVLVPAEQRAGSHGFVLLRRTARPDPASRIRGPLRIASPARAVVDAARAARTDDQARAIVLEAVQRRLVSCRELRHEIEAGATRGSKRTRLVVREAERGAWSVPEGDLMRLLDSSAILPPALANPRLTTPGGRRLPTPDAWLDEVGLAVQVHSRTYHSRDADWDATVMTDGLLVENGAVVLGVTPTRIGSDPAGVLHRIETTYLSLLGRPRPAIVVRARSPAGRGRS